MSDIVRKRGGGPNELTGMRSGQNVADRDLADMLSQIQHNIEVLAGRLETLERMVAMQDEPEFVERPQEVIQQTTEESTDVTWNVIDKLVRQTTKYAKAATGQEIRYAAVYEKATKAALDAIPAEKVVPSSFGRVGDTYYVRDKHNSAWSPVVIFYTAASKSGLPALQMPALGYAQNAGKVQAYVNLPGQGWFSFTDME